MSNPTEKPEKGRRWHTAALIGVLGLAAFLHFYRLEQEGFANLYYAATVRSMLVNSHNFFFASFDPAGFVTVDKPPLGLWVQALSALVFGFRGWSLLLPQALAGVLSVALLYHLVRRVFGATAGLVAALVLALTPISVAANRNNTMDSLLVLTSLLAAWAASLATERGRLRWLLLCALLVGVGFNIKMLQAFLVLPAFMLMYLFAAPVRWWKRLLHLSLAAVVTAVVSISWALIVDATPADQRPFIGSSHNNTVLELVVGHNGAARLGQMGRWLGLGRLLPGPPPRNLPPPGPAPSGAPPAQASLPGPADGETGRPGPLRLFNRQLAGQASWFLPLAFLGLLAAAWQPETRQRSRRAALWLWGIWLLPQVIFFSYAGLFHRYYLEMMAPAIAALVGAGLCAMWRDYNRWLYTDPATLGISQRPSLKQLGQISAGAIGGWLLLLALAGTAAAEVTILLPFPDWAARLVPPVVGISLACVLGLAAVWLVRRMSPPEIASRRSAWAAGLSSLGLLALLAAPAVWAAIPVWYGGDAGLPFAGAELLPRPPRGAAQNDALVNFLSDNHHGETFILATINARTAAPVILANGEPVMAIGGFSGGDRILSLQALQAMLREGQVRFFLLPGSSAWPPPTTPQPPGAPSPAPPLAPPQQAELVLWIQGHCRVVPEPLWDPFAPRPGDPPGPNEPHQLWDCKPH